MNNWFKKRFIIIVRNAMIQYKDEEFIDVMIAHTKRNIRLGVIYTLSFSVPLTALITYLIMKHN